MRIGHAQFSNLDCADEGEVSLGRNESPTRASQNVALLVGKEEYEIESTKSSLKDF
jgi:hypothetical protein